MRKALWFVLVVALAGVGASVVSGDGSAASAATSPTWQKIPGLRPEIGSGPPPPIGSASGRVWFALGGPEGSLSMTVTSATVSGGTLKSVKTTRLADEGLYARLIVGSELLYSTDANGVGKVRLCDEKTPRKWWSRRADSGSVRRCGDHDEGLSCSAIRCRSSVAGPSGPCLGRQRPSHPEVSSGSAVRRKVRPSSSPS